jgi:hypothetical protein
MAHLPHFKALLRRFQPTLDNRQVQDIFRETLFASLKEERLVTASMFAKVARRRGVLFMPPRPAVLPLAQTPAYDDYALLSDIYLCAKSNIERLFNEAVGRIDLQGRLLVDEKVLTAFQASKVRT